MRAPPRGLRRLAGPSKTLRSPQNRETSSGIIEPCEALARANQPGVLGILFCRSSERNSARLRVLGSPGAPKKRLGGLASEHIHLQDRGGSAHPETVARACHSPEPNTEGSLYSQTACARKLARTASPSLTKHSRAAKEPWPRPGARSPSPRLLVARSAPWSSPYLQQK